MDLEIREFSDGDGEAVVDLWQACGLVVPQNDPRKDIERKLRAGRDLFLVGERGGRLVASVMGGYDGHRGWINYLAVDPACRGEGLGRQIMAAVEARLGELGCAKINLQVRASNPEVIAFYRAIGYGEDPVLSMGKRLVQD